MILRLTNLRFFAQWYVQNFWTFSKRQICFHFHWVDLRKLGYVTNSEFLVIDTLGQRNFLAMKFIEALIFELISLVKVSQPEEIGQVVDDQTVYEFAFANNQMLRTPALRHSTFLSLTFLTTFHLLKLLLLHKIFIVTLHLVFR